MTDVTKFKFSELSEEEKEAVRLLATMFGTHEGGWAHPDSLDLDYGAFLFKTKQIGVYQPIFCSPDDED